jgi:UDP-glucuronate 4-epimerase
MKILVTGAAGFIGSHISRALVWRGDEVVGIDNFNDYYARKCKEFNINLIDLAANQSPTFTDDNDNESLNKVFAKLKKYAQIEDSGTTNLEAKTSSVSDAKESGRFKFYEVDITDYNKLKSLFEKERFDSIVHLAAMAGVPLSTKNPRLYTQVNVDGTVNLLELAKNNGVKKFVFGSSSSVYGNRDDKKVTETDDVTRAESPYGATKVAGEVICHAISKVFGINVVIVRIFGPIYGPLQRPYGMLMQRAINFVHNGKKVQIYGRKGLDSAKDSTYIDDQIEGILKCLDFSTNFDVFNIGTSDPKSINDWFQAISKNFGKEVEYEITESDKGDVASSSDISKAKKILNYEPKMNLDEGVRRQVEIFNLMPEWYKSMENV